jgi:hypothetical protein
MFGFKVESPSGAERLVTEGRTENFPIFNCRFLNFVSMIRTSYSVITTNMGVANRPSPHKGRPKPGNSTFTPQDDLSGHVHH